METFSDWGKPIRCRRSAKRGSERRLPYCRYFNPLSRNHFSPKREKWGTLVSFTLWTRLGPPANCSSMRGIGKNYRAVVGAGRAHTRQIE